MSVECLSAKEEARDADEVHQLGNQEASNQAKGDGDNQEEESRRIELEVGDKLLAKDGKDRREDIQGKAVAAHKVKHFMQSFGQVIVDGQQGRNGEVSY